MSFSFGTSAAPASSSFSFGGAAPLAPVSSFGLGATSAPAPASSAFGFVGSNPAPATTFGAPNPAPGGAFNFSGLSTAGFGLAPTSAPASFSFASPSNAVPSVFNISAFGGQQVQQQQQQPIISISGNMQYTDLSPQMKQAIDTMHEAIMRHKRSMMNLQTMAPQLLLPAETSMSNKISVLEKERGATGKALINEKLSRLHSRLDRVQADVETLQLRVHTQMEADENSVVQAIMYAKWPVEALSHRKGIRRNPSPAPTFQEEKKDDNAVALTVQARVRESLDRAMSVVDRIEKMPSPYLWNVIHDMERKVLQLREQTISLRSQLEQSPQSLVDFSLHQDPAARIAEVVEVQHQTIWRITSRLDQLRSQMELVRYRYRQYERGENVLDKAANEEITRQRRLNEQIQMNFMLAPQKEQEVSTSTGSQSTTGPSTFVPGPNPALAPTSSFSFSGSTPAVAAPSTGTSSSFSFAGSSFSNPPASEAAATASSGTGFSFSAPSAAAPAPVSTQPAFGQPAAAPSFGSSGNTPAPTAFGLNTPAPSGVSLPSAKKKTSTRSSRLRR